jgi:hypothetical protein
MSGHESLPRVDSGRPAEFGPEDQALFDKIADRIARRSLAVPAIFFLESSKPLSFVGSQALVFFEPFIRAVVNVPSYDRFVSLMEQRENVERLIQAIERRDAELVREQKAARAAERTAQRPAGRTSKWRRWFSGRS